MPNLGNLIERFVHDLRYGARSLLGAPGFTAIALVALSLGIGANTAIFSVVNAVLLRPLNYQDPDRLVTVLHYGTSPVSAANYRDWRDQSISPESGSFESMGAAEYWSPNLVNSDPPEHLLGLRVTQSMLPMLGVKPLLGRLFLPGPDKPGEDNPGEEGEVILSYRLWQRRFGSDPRVLGKALTLDARVYTVVGVMPADFQFAPFWATHAELWAPLAFGERVQQRTGNSLRVFGRLKKGATLPQARAQIAAITARLEREYPGTNREVIVTPLKQMVTGKIEAPLLMLLAAGGFVLLIACANVAHMLLARTSDRQKEIAIRTALGAGRARVIGQFVTENLLLAAVGGFAGLLLASWGLRVLIRLSPEYIPRVGSVRMDGHVLLFLLAITLFTALLFGVAPALQSAAGNLSGALKENARGDSAGLRRTRLRSFLAASEFALAFLLLIGAGLMIRSFLHLRALDPGFHPKNVLSMVVSVAGSKESEPPRREMFYRALLGKVRAIPGVLSAGAINHLPLAGDTWGYTFNIEGRPKPLPGESPTAVYRVAMPGYFETMRLPLIRGRYLTGTDDARTSGVVVLNERAANVYWPGDNPLGKRIAFDADTASPVWLTVIGIVRNAKQQDWAADPSPEVYLSALQNKDFLGAPASRIAYITLVVRTAGDPGALASAVKEAVWSFDHNLPVSQVVTMDRVVADSTAQPRFEMLLLGILAAVSLTLATIGIYGVMSYSVSRRTHEIGIRISLGASRSAVVRMVIRQGAALALWGSLAGAGGALLLTRLIASMLYGVRPADPLTFCGVAFILGIAALAAAGIPARKATRIEPAVALRHE